MRGMGQFDEWGVPIEYATVDYGGGSTLTADMGLDWGTWGADTYDISTWGTDWVSDYAGPMLDIAETAPITDLQTQFSDVNLMADVGQAAESTGLSFQFPDISLQDVANLVKTGFSIYQAYETLQMQKDAIAAGASPTAVRTMTTPVPTGYVRDPRTGQLVPVRTTAGQVLPTGTVAPQAAGQIVPGVSNTMLAVGVGAAALLFLTMGKRR